VAVAPRPQPRPVVAARPVEVPSPEELGIRLDAEPVVIPEPAALGITLN
jgi:hypothetical protein